MADNQYVNKLVVNNQTLLDLTGDTITPADLKSGVTAHDKSGAPITGSLVVPVVQSSKSFEVLSDGIYEIVPDASYDGIGKLVITVNVSNCDCEMDGVMYTNLSDAVAAAVNGSEITLLRDISLNSDLEIFREITINGNGKLLSSGGGVNSFYIKQNGGLTLSNLRLIASQTNMGSGIVATNSNSVECYDVEIFGNCALSTMNGACIYLQNCTLETNYLYWGGNNNTGSRITLDGCDNSIRITEKNPTSFSDVQIVTIN